VYIIILIIIFFFNPRDFENYKKSVKLETPLIRVINNRNKMLGYRRETALQGAL